MSAEAALAFRQDSLLQIVAETVEEETSEDLSGEVRRLFRNSSLDSADADHVLLVTAKNPEGLGVAHEHTEQSFQRLSHTITPDERMPAVVQANAKEGDLDAPPLAALPAAELRSRPEASSAGRAGDQGYLQRQ
ncbi:hypothetical protein SprV_0301167000 [Sparganum proliferum]